jgi:hypothetical protein
MTLDAALLVAPSASVREALETITKNSRQAVMWWPTTDAWSAW